MVQMSRRQSEAQMFLLQISICLDLPFAYSDSRFHMKICSSIKVAAHQLARSLGYDFTQKVRLSLFLNDVDLLIDVGAHWGETYNLFRKEGYSKKIISFEPSPESFKRLCDKQGFDWEKRQFCLSDRSGRQLFYLQADSTQNSLHRSDSSESIEVECRRLDSFDFSAHKTIFLKIDTEGHDLNVVLGASGMLDRVKYIRLEARTTPALKDESSFSEIVSKLHSWGYRLSVIDRAYVFNGCYHREFDAIFEKENFQQ
jgi:FkbM family methyltransferase